MEEQLNERLLGVWLGLSAVLRNDRFTQKISYNEAFVCSLLARRQAQKPEHPRLTMGDLRGETRMIKSQVNKVVTDLEQKGFVERRRADHDRRVVCVELTEKGRAVYTQEHDRILAFVDRVIDDIGKRDAHRTVKLLGKIIVCVDRLTQ